MNDNAKLWAKALVSGEFKQTKRVLTRLDEETGEVLGHCCLGVACEVYRLNGGQLPFRDNADGEARYYADTGAAYGRTESSAALPDVVREWLGLRDGMGEFGDGDKDTSLADLNDEGINFGHIAAIIASEPRGLFA